MTNRKAWIIGAYGRNGGNDMNHHIGRVCKELFDLETRSVGIGTSVYEPNNIFDHEYIFEQYDLQEFFTQCQDSDLVISNPSFSPYLIGYKTNATKIMYVQHYNTYNKLDLGFDKYIAVSDIVRKAVKSIYDINAEIIPAFTNDVEKITPLTQKKNGVFIYPKSMDGYYYHFMEKIEDAIKDLPRYLLSAPLNRKELMSIIDQHKYFITFSIDEGFGLVSLEAMKRGCVVLGFDGYGGREFMQKGHNCLTSSYPDWQSIVANLNKCLTDETYAATISQNAIESANDFNRERFYNSWEKAIKEALN